MEIKRLAHGEYQDKTQEAGADLRGEFDKWLKQASPPKAAFNMKN